MEKESNCFSLCASLFYIKQIISERDSICVFCNVKFRLMFWHSRSYVLYGTRSYMITPRAHNRNGLMAANIMPHPIHGLWKIHARAVTARAMENDKIKFPVTG